MYRTFLIHLLFKVPSLVILCYVFLFIFFKICIVWLHLHKDSKIVSLYVQCVWRLGRGSVNKDGWMGK